MNWDAVGAIGEVAGAAGVIIKSLLFVQIRHNSTMMKGSYKQSISEASTGNLQDDRRGGPYGEAIRW